MILHNLTLIYEHVSMEKAVTVSQQKRDLTETVSHFLDSLNLFADILPLFLAVKRTAKNMCIQAVVLQNKLSISQPTFKQNCFYLNFIGQYTEVLHNCWTCTRTTMYMQTFHRKVTTTRSLTLCRSLEHHYFLFSKAHQKGLTYGTVALFLHWKSSAIIELPVHVLELSFLKFIML